MNKIAIVGKPNVGKSTLFNRIIKQKLSIVDDEAGVTRDRIYGNGTWLTKNFQVIDTGGLQVDDFQFKEAIQYQVEYAMKEANTIMFVVSLKDGLNNDDEYVASILKRIKNKKIILVVNKSESSKNYENNYYNFGFGKPFFVSSVHGIGIGDLLDEIIINDDYEVKVEDSFRFSIIGRPNVGKSSLVNTILNDQRVIVSDIAGTTRDSIDSKFKRNKENYTIIDTAGIKRKGKIKTNVDKYSYLRAQKALTRSDVSILMIDGSEDFTEIDEVIGGLIFKANIPSIIAVNKWDKIEKTNTTMNEYIKDIRRRFKFLSWSPIIFFSALENKRIDSLFDEIKKIRETLKKVIPSSSLNDVLHKAQMMNNTPKHGGGLLKINHATQVKGQLPTFVLFCNNPNFLHFTYARYIENKIREAFGFDNIPITVYYKNKNSKIRTKEQKDEE